MESYAVVGYVLLSALLIGCAVLTMALISSRHARKQLAASMKYLLDRLKVSEANLTRVSEELDVLQEHFRRRGLLDDEDLATLRRELIERPRQSEAEKNELLGSVLVEEGERRIIKNTPDTLH